MKKPLALEIALALFLIRIPCWAGLYFNECYDNARFQNDFSRNDDLFAYAAGVSSKKLAGDPMPYVGGFITQRTVVAVDPSFQRILWNYYDPSNNSYGIRDFSTGFYYPRSVALTGSGELFISDSGNHRVVKMLASFGPNGLNMEWVKTFGRIGTGEGQFLNSFELAVGENPLRVFVSDWSNNNIQVFDGDGNYLQTIGTYGNGPGQFYGPRGMAVAANGYLYVADTGNRRIQGFRYFPANESYVFDKQIAASESGPIPMNAKLTHVALGSHQVFIVDEQNERIYLFDGNMNYLAAYLGNPGSPFKNLRDLNIPPADTTWSTCQALTMETDRIQLFQIGMDVVNAHADPSPFYPLAPERNITRLKYTLTENGLVLINIYDANNNVVRHLVPQGIRTIGANEEIWDGKDDNGNALPGGVYQLFITACDQNGYEGHPVKWVYKPVPVFIHQTPVVSISSAAPSVIQSGQNAVVNYSLSQEGSVKVEVLDGQNSVIRVLNDGTGPLLPTGAHSVAWNGAYNENYWARPPDGYYWIRIQAKDSEGYWGEPKSVRVGVANAPSAELSPPSNNTYGLDARIVGKVSGFLVNSYSLEYSPDGENWTALCDKTIDSGGNSFTSLSGELARWNTGLLPASEATHYKILLRSRNQAGAVSTVEADSLVDNIPPRLPILSAAPEYFSPQAAATGSTQNAAIILYSFVDANLDNVRLEYIDRFLSVKYTEPLSLTFTTGTSVWNGLDNLGLLVDDGPMTCRIVAQDKGGNISQRDSLVTVDSNRWPETVTISSTIKLSIDLGPGNLNFRPAWTANGRQIAFTKSEDPYANVINVFLKNADNTGSETRLTNYSISTYPVRALQPDLEPNGQRLLFHDGGSIFIKGLGANNAVKIGDGIYPRWSPDGTKVAFMQEIAAGQYRICVMNPDGSGLRPITPGFYPSWSPDSQALLYCTSSQTDIYSSQVFSLSLDGQNRIGPLANSAINPEYSPDGNLLAYLYYGGRIYYVRPSDGFDQVLIDKTNQNQATWSPDGSRIAYSMQNGDAFVSQISRPDRYANLSAVLQMPLTGAMYISGTAADLNFSGYELSYAHENPSSNWVVIKQSNVEVKDGSLGDWNTSGLSGDYWLKLSACDKALNRKEILKQVRIGNFAPVVITDVHALPETIYPDRPGQDASQIFYTVQGSLTSPIALTLSNEAGVIYRNATTPGNLGVNSYTWDGKDDSGNLVPSGRWIFRLRAQSGADSIYKEGAIFVADTSLKAIIASPADGSYVKRYIAFQGTAAGLEFSQYRLTILRVGSSDQPTIIHGASRVENASLGYWTAPADGYYAVTLTVANQANLEQSQNLSFNVDEIPPETTAVIKTVDKQGYHDALTYFSNGVLHIGNRNVLVLASQDAGVGANVIQYRLNHEDLQTYIDPVSLGTPGAQTITYYATDKLNNQESEKSLSLVVNFLSPETTLQIGQPQYQSGGILFVSGQTKFTLSATETGDTAVPIDKIYWYRALVGTGGQIQIYSQPFTLNEYAGSDTLSFCGQDLVGNRESAKKADIYLDLDPPTTTLEPSGPSPNQDAQGTRYATRGTMYILNAVDNDSQVDHIEYQLVSSTAVEDLSNSVSAWNQYLPGEKIILTSEGEHVIRYRAADHVSNSETAKIYQVIVDNTPPRIVLSGIAAGGVYAPPVVPAIEIIDSHLKDQQVLLDSQPYVTGEQISDLGDHLLSISAVDWAGNSAIVQAQFTLAQTTPTPTVTPTATTSPTCTYTPSITATETPTYSSTPTLTNTETPTASNTPTASPSQTQTTSPTPSATSTGTQTPSPTATPTVTETLTASFTPTATYTPSATVTQSPTPTSTPSSTQTHTLTATLTYTRTMIPSTTVTSTPSFTSTPISTPTPTSTPLQPQHVRAWPDGSFFMLPGERKTIFAMSVFKNDPQPNISLRFTVVRGTGSFIEGKEGFGMTAPDAGPAQAVFTSSNEPRDVNIVKVDNLGLGGAHFVLLLVLPQQYPQEAIRGANVGPGRLNLREALLVFDSEEEALSQAEKLLAEMREDGEDKKSITPTRSITASATPTQLSSQTITPTKTCTSTSTATPRSLAPSGQIVIYPNPAKDRVTFLCLDAIAMRAVIDIYNLSGERISRIDGREKEVDGGLKIVWDAKELGRGLFLCRITLLDATGRQICQQMKKVVLIR